MNVWISVCYLKAAVIGSALTLDSRESNVTLDSTYGERNRTELSLLVSIKAFSTVKSHFST